MYILRNPLKNYPWGSHTLLADFELREVSARPEAERWMGTHTAGTSSVQMSEGERSLSALRRSAGHATGELPFLLKVLAAAMPLSLQAHPNSAQALAGFERENASGVALDAPNRNYKDPHAKPELLVALSHFEALSGFRTMKAIAQTFAHAGSALLAQSIAEAVAFGDGAGQQHLFQVWMAARDTWLPGALKAFRAHASQTLEPGTDAWWSKAVEAFPEDPTVLLALLLEHVHLEPGEGIFLPAGNLHAYLGGLGVELMGPSDNVLRGGMTAKYIDVPELEHVLSFAPFRPEVLRAEDTVAPRAWPTPNAPFCLARERVSGPRAWVPSALDEIVLCVEGSPKLDGQALRRGEAVYISKDSAPRHVAGDGLWVRASAAGAAWSVKVNAP